MKAVCFLLLILATLKLPAQTNSTPSINPPGINLDSQHAEEIRAKCLQGRRMICGKIIKVLPEGLVVESGYTNLLRPPLDKSWLIPGTVTVTRPTNSVEGNSPGCVAVGLVFLSHLPKSRSAQPHQYDYVVIQGYPAGDYTYSSVGDIERTVRSFTTTLPGAVQLILRNEEDQKKSARPVN